MRPMTRKKKIMLARGIVVFLFVLLVTVILNGIFSLIAGSTNSMLKRLAVSVSDALYLTSSCKCNAVFGYCANDSFDKDTLLGEFFEQVPINHYAVHHGVIHSDAFFQNEDDFYEAGLSETIAKEDPSESLIVQYEKGMVTMLPDYQKKPSKEIAPPVVKENATSVFQYIEHNYDMDVLSNFNKLINSYYLVDASTRATPELFDASKLLSKDLSIQKDTDGPQILIYHTHASESFIDSRKGAEEDTVVGLGNYLTDLLTSYGYKVYHDRTAYDRLPNGEDNRNYSYSTAYPKIKEFLDQNPTVQVVIDLHRDSGVKPVTVINGKKCASIMFFNGLCRNKNGPIERLSNPYLEDNLAFSFQAAMVGRKLYDGLIYRNYLKNYRYNMHLKPRYMLVELGTVNNTVQEAYNSIEPLSVILDTVLSNKVAKGE